MDCRQRDCECDEWRDVSEEVEALVRIDLLVLGPEFGPGDLKGAKWLMKLKLASRELGRAQAKSSQRSRGMSSIQSERSMLGT